MSEEVISAEKILLELETVHRRSGSCSPELAQAMESLKKSGLPSTKNEDWKYTSLKDFSELELKYSSSLEGVDWDCSEFKTPNLIFLNGRFLESKSNLPKKSKLRKLQANLSESEESFKKHFGAFDEINFLSIQENIELNLEDGEKIHLYHLCSPHNLSSIFSSRLLINLRAGANASVVEYFLDEDSSYDYHHNVILDVKLERTSHLEFLSFNKQNLAKSYTFSKRRVRQNRDSKLSLYTFIFGSKLLREETHIQLLEQNAECRFGSFALCNEGRHVDFFTYLDHLAPHTFSDQLYKSTIKDNSRSVFTGTVYVHKDCPGVESAQLNKNLIIGQKGHADSRPQLEVYNDDVKCAHGSTTGRLSDEELFYLVSRGIDPDSAAKLLSSGFALDVAEKIESDEMRELVKNEIKALDL